MAADGTITNIAHVFVQEVSVEDVERLMDESKEAKDYEERCGHLPCQSRQMQGEHRT